MATATVVEERNFRTHYYEKVGFRGVEEKKSLNILLKEEKVDLGKLSQFCLRFAVPSGYRELVWKLLLGVLPAHQCAHDFVSQQHSIQYSDLQHTLNVIRKIEPTTTACQEFLLMYSIEENQLGLNTHRIFISNAGQRFMAIARAFADIIDNNIDAYWLTKGVLKHIEKFSGALEILPEKVEVYMKKEDIVLHSHLTKTAAYQKLPFKDWFDTSFADLLPEIALERVLDKVIGGSCKVLVFVAVSMLITLRRPLLSMSNTDDILLYIQKCPHDSGDMIVNKGIDLWQKHGALLMPTGKTTGLH